VIVAKRIEHPTTTVKLLVSVNRAKAPSQSADAVELAIEYFHRDASKPGGNIVRGVELGGAATAGNWGWFADLECNSLSPPWYGSLATARAP
jgi:hypothetical protein